MGACLEVFKVYPGGFGGICAGVSKDLDYYRKWATLLTVGFRSQGQGIPYSDVHSFEFITFYSSCCGTLVVYRKKDRTSTCCS